jgi:ankyrin repeat protein
VVNVLVPFPFGFKNGTYKLIKKEESPMPINLDSLLTEIHLNPTYENETQLNTLATWCKENISKDFHSTGEFAEQYEDYCSLAKGYLEDFLPYIPNSLASPVPQFGELNTLNYAVKCGYHLFIENQNISLDLVNLPNKNLMTPLHTSAVFGYLHTTETLLAKGANSKVMNKLDQYPLYQALFLPIQFDELLVDAKKAIFNLLAERTPQIWLTQDQNGDSVLHLMATHDVYADLAQESLPKALALVFTHNNALRYPIHTAILNNQSKMTCLLLGIDNVSNLEDGQQRTALHYAARYGTAEIIELCIKATSEIDKRDSEFKTPMLLAAEAGNMDAVKYLFAQGTDVHATDLDGLSILHHAINSQNEQLICWLLTWIPKNLVNLPDGRGHTALFYAKEHHNERLESLLLEAGAHASPDPSI